MSTTPTLEEDRSKKMSTRTKIVLAVGAGAFVLGLTLGAALTPTPAAAPAEPAAPAADPVTITKSITPDSCLAALKSADELNGLVALSFSDLGAGIKAIADGDLAESDRMATKVIDRADTITSVKMTYNGYATGCRSESK